MKVGAPFNPYKLFRGVFAPYWLPEHRGISTGAKLCYIRLLGFAGKDARCYPSLERLGMSLGVSERQARDYDKELQRAGLIIVEQRGLRKTNMYLFVWTAELENMSNCVLQNADHPDESDEILEDRPLDRNSGSDQGRNSSSGQDRNSIAGPSGINSVGISSSESSSSSVPLQAGSQVRKKTESDQKPETGLPQKEQITKTKAVVEPASVRDRSSSVERGREKSARISPDAPQGSDAPEIEQQTQAEAGMSAPALLILEWAAQRHIRRRRDDHSYGHPDAHWAEQWGVYCQERGIREPDEVLQVMDVAKATADRREQWRYWKYLDEQVQQAAERYVAPDPHPTTTPEPELTCPVEDPNTEWAHVKRILAARLNPIGYANWVERTCQIGWDSTGLLVWVPDEVTRDWLEHEYAGAISEALATVGCVSVQYTRRHDNSTPGATCPPDKQPGDTSGEIACANPEYAIVPC